MSKVVDLKKERFGFSSAYTLLEGMVKVFGWKSVQLALDDIRRKTNEKLIAELEALDESLTKAAEEDNA